jgi:hypothetical protein
MAPDYGIGSTGRYEKRVTLLRAHCAMGSGPERPCIPAEAEQVASYRERGGRVNRAEQRVAGAVVIA